MEKIKVVNLSNNPLPKYETNGSVGMDLRAWVSSEKTKAIEESFIQSRDGGEPVIYIRRGGRVVIDTGLKLQLPDGYEAQIRCRSGLAAKKGVIAVLGTIDSDYRGHVMITLINYGAEPFTVQSGDRIAQMVFNKCEKFELETVSEIDQTERNEGGFGHTGIQ